MTQQNRQYKNEIKMWMKLHNNILHKNYNIIISLHRHHRHRRIKAVDTFNFHTTTCCSYFFFVIL